MGTRSRDRRRRTRRFLLEAARTDEPRGLQLRRTTGRQNDGGCCSSAARRGRRSAAEHPGPDHLRELSFCLSQQSKSPACFYDDRPRASIAILEKARALCLSLFFTDRWCPHHSFAAVLLSCRAGATTAWPDGARSLYASQPAARHTHTRTHAGALQDTVRPPGSTAGSVSRATWHAHPRAPRVLFCRGGVDRGCGFGRRRGRRT